MNDELVKLLEIGNNIKLNPVFSSNIKGIGYDTQHKLMTVLFTGGSKYLYENVELDVYNSIVNSESIGKALNECVVRNKEKYKYHKLIS